MKKAAGENPPLFLSSKSIHLKKTRCRELPDQV
jgi:hypothetical protein